MDSSPRFCCLRCSKNSSNEESVIWTSSYTTVLFRAYYGPDTDENGDVWFGGWIQMKFFAQQCRTCNGYATFVLDNYRIRLLVQWLHRWIANQYYGFRYQSRGYLGTNQRREPHLENLCDACRTGWCAYQRRQRTRQTAGALAGGQ